LLLSWLVDEESDDLVDVGEADEEVEDALILFASSFFNFLAILFEAGEPISLFFDLRFLIKEFFVSSDLS
jgi:hypothetical protein